MQVYLPIAEISVDALLLIGLGALVGLLSGMFGVGGGFLLTPLLILIGVPPAVAVATGANQVVATSVSGAINSWRRGNVDTTMGLLLLAAGLVGGAGGVMLFEFLQRRGQIDLVIQLVYVVVLGTVGTLMVVEAAATILRRLRKKPGQRTRRGRLHEHYWIHGWPLKIRFRRSKLYISAIPPILIGMSVGVLTTILGVGGGFLLVPAMIYLFGMPTLLGIGTSQFQILFVTAAVTLMHALTTQTVDIVLALPLIVGGVVGAQLGQRLGQRLGAEQLRGLLALVVLGVALRLAYDLVATPFDIFSIGSGAK